MCIGNSFLGIVNLSHRAATVCEQGNISCGLYPFLFFLCDTLNQV